MEDNILKDNDQNFLDAAQAFDQFLNQINIQDNKEDNLIKILDFIKNNKKSLFKDIE